MLTEPRRGGACLRPTQRGVATQGRHLRGSTLLAEQLLHLLGLRVLPCQPPQGRIGYREALSQNRSVSAAYGKLILDARRDK